MRPRLEFTFALCPTPTTRPARGNLFIGLREKVLTINQPFASRNPSQAASLCSAPNFPRDSCSTSRLRPSSAREKTSPSTRRTPPQALKHSRILRLRRHRPAKNVLRMIAGGAAKDRGPTPKIPPLAWRKLADAPDLGSGSARSGGSSPSASTSSENRMNSSSAGFSFKLLETIGSELKRTETTQIYPQFTLGFGRPTSAFAHARLRLPSCSDISDTQNSQETSPLPDCLFSQRVRRGCSRILGTSSPSHTARAASAHDPLP